MEAFAQSFTLDLWYESYDILLRMEIAEKTCLIGYADAVAELVTVFGALIRYSSK